MKKIIIAIFCLVCISANADGFDTLGVDYNLTDVVIRPLSVGISTWIDDDNGTIPAVYGSVCCVSHENFIRLELGAVFTVTDKLEVVPLTGVSVPLEDFVVGVWYAPFWNLYQPESSDDPWGVMVGYRF